MKIHTQFFEFQNQVSNIKLAIDIIVEAWNDVTKPACMGCAVKLSLT